MSAYTVQNTGSGAVPPAVRNNSCHDPLLSEKQRWDKNGHLLVLAEEISVALVICLRWGQPTSPSL